ncbi:LysR family transcriptional regulator [Thaumasiovibrio subtropicus]|uniref:LysR family transcriptional regulator n=1 Tax=Thaumasiovibrio subtropicus TaxID=1891207 RepID=UPI000B361551|nr:LysR family transcriptional regulator [Thaumasiovibrio subtropicus]
MNQFDVNLLRVLAVLLEERSVTAAAERLFLSQSAVSKQLAKLRLAFDDPLFERESKGLSPTPKALSLAPKIHAILLQVDQLTLPELFEPSLSRRTFDFELLETAYSVTFPLFMPKALQEAPNISVNSKTWNEGSLKRLLRCESDFGIAIFEWDERATAHASQIPEELNAVELVKDYSVCVMRVDHPAAKEPWNLATFLKYRHLQVTTGGISGWMIQAMIEAQRHSLDNAVHMSDLRSAIELIEQTDLLMCYPVSTIHRFLATNNLIVRPLPIEIAPAGHFLLWHKNFENDPSHRWLRELIIRHASGNDWWLKLFPEPV